MERLKILVVDDEPHEKTGQGFFGKRILKY